MEHILLAEGCSFLDVRRIQDHEHLVNSSLVHRRERQLFYIDLFYQKQFYQRHTFKTRVSRLQAWESFVSKFREDKCGCLLKIYEARDKFGTGSIVGKMYRIHRLSLFHGYGCAIASRSACPQCTPLSPKLNESVAALYFSTSQFPQDLRDAVSQYLWSAEAAESASKAKVDDLLLQHRYEISQQVEELKHHFAEEMDRARRDIEELKNRLIAEQASRARIHDELGSFASRMQDLTRPPVSGFKRRSTDRNR